MLPYEKEVAFQFSDQPYGGISNSLKFVKTFVVRKLHTDEYENMFQCKKVEN